jgi:hypothetical protein
LFVGGWGTVWWLRALTLQLGCWTQLLAQTLTSGVTLGTSHLTFVFSSVRWGQTYSVHVFAGY